MKKILCLPLLSLMVSLLFAQDKKLAEQLRLELKLHRQQDSTRVKRLIELSWAEVDLDQKERWAREALAFIPNVQNHLKNLNTSIFHQKCCFGSYSGPFNHLITPI
ncbi:MAG: hypothetical protein H7122_05590 [Chitinophagaceae bacterium]|nr:hypothetical protein [Chitinophagaceae bacterium]